MPAVSHLAAVLVGACLAAVLIGAQGAQDAARYRILVSVAACSPHRQLPAAPASAPPHLNPHATLPATPRHRLSWRLVSRGAHGVASAAKNGRPALFARVTCDSPPPCGMAPAPAEPRCPPPRPPAGGHSPSMDTLALGAALAAAGHDVSVVVPQVQRWRVEVQAPGVSERCSTFPQPPPPAPPPSSYAPKRPHPLGAPGRARWPSACAPRGAMAAATARRCCAGCPTTCPSQQRQVCAAPLTARMRPRRMAAARRTRPHRVRARPTRCGAQRSSP